MSSSAVFDTTVPVLILKVGHYPFHHGGVGIARSMGRVGIRVYGVFEDRFIPGAVSRYVRGKFLWQNSDVSPDEFLNGMAEIGRYVSRPTVVLPTDDYGAILLAEHGHALTETFVFPRQPIGLPRTVASKDGLYRLCKDLGVPCPEAVFPATRDEVEEFLARADFPVVVKRTSQWRLQHDTTVKSTTIAESPDALLEILGHVEDFSGAGLMFQEYIPREQGEDWIFHGYCNESSDCLVGFTGIKLRSYPAYAGPTTLGLCVENQELRQQAEELFKSINYRGIMDLDYRLDRRDGQYKLLDFNPRIGAQFRLFVDGAGIDVVKALHLDLTGRAVPRSSQVEGRRFMAEHYDVLAGWAYHRDRRLTLRDWLRSVRRVEEVAWFHGDDLWPFVVMSSRFLLRGIERTIGKMWPARRGRRRVLRLVPAVGQARKPRYIGRRWAPVGEGRRPGERLP
jgi:predicted ATP-grasp superfamily ATP-dependent carboligase